MLVYDEEVPIHVLGIAILIGLLPSTDFEIREAIVRIAKTNTILKQPVNILFTVEIHIMTLTKQMRQENKSLGEK